MKQLQVVAADAGSTSTGERIQPDQRPTRVPLVYTLSPEELDTVHGGFVGMWSATIGHYVPIESQLQAGVDFDVVVL